MVVYVDTNVFVFAVLDTGYRGDIARDFLRDVVAGKKQAATAVLTIEEFIWALKKETGDKKLAVEQGKRLMSLAQIQFLSVTESVMQEAVQLMEETSLQPRDAIHVCVAKSKKITDILSDDADFDGLDSVRRIPLA